MPTNPSPWLSGIAKGLSHLSADLMSRRALDDQRKRTASQDALQRLILLQSLGGTEIPAGTDPTRAVSQATDFNAMRSGGAIPNEAMGIEDTETPSFYGAPRSVQIPGPDGQPISILLDPSKTPQAMQERRMSVQDAAARRREEAQRNRPIYDPVRGVTVNPGLGTASPIAGLPNKPEPSSENDRTPANFKVNGKPVAGSIDKQGRRYDSAGTLVSGSVEPWEPTQQPSYSFPVITGPDGSPVVARANSRTGDVTPTGVGAKPGSTSDVSKQAAGFHKRMTSASKILGPLEDDPEFSKSLSGILGSPSGTGAIPRIGNYTMGPKAQSYKQAQQDWVRAKLRKESGAVIGKDEMADEVATYFPQPGDSEEVKRQKRAARATAEEAMLKSAGAASGGAQPDASSDAGGGRTITVNGKTFKVPD